MYNSNNDELYRKIEEIGQSILSHIKEKYPEIDRSPDMLRLSLRLVLSSCHSSIIQLETDKERGVYRALDSLARLQYSLDHDLKVNNLQGLLEYSYEDSGNEEIH